LSEYLPGAISAARACGTRGSFHENVQRLVRSTVSPDLVGGARETVTSLGRRWRAAVRVDRGACGIFCFDVQGRAACVTEINAGRFSMSTNLYDLVGRHNMASSYVRLALGRPVNVRGEYEATEDYYMVRNLDTLAGIFHADDLGDGIEDARP
jgi:hypothetical protein